MGFRELISETEAAAFAGVSQRTLKRFIDSGYLKAEHDADGLPLFDKEEVSQLFGLAAERMVANVGNRIIPSVQTAHSEKIIDIKLASASGLRASTPRSAEDMHRRIFEKREDAFSADSAQSSEDMQVHTEAYAVLESEILRLKHVLDLQERLLEERDREIHQITSDRDWLRKRIERLEEKSERDQILLLSGTQTIRKLVNAQVERKTPLRAMLEWFGLAAPSSQLPLLPAQQAPTTSQPRQDEPQHGD